MNNRYTKPVIHCGLDEAIDEFIQRMAARDCECGCEIIEDDDVDNFDHLVWGTVQ